MNDTRYTPALIESLKRNVRDKKMWIAQTAATHGISDSEKLAIEASLPKFSKAFDLSDVCRAIEVYNEALKEVIWKLCDKFNLPTPTCNYFKD